MRIPPVTLVIGGAASGKSAWAEELVRGSDLAKVYIATAEAHDAEMEAKIAAHRKARAGQGWRTVEAPLALPKALAELDTEEIGLVDCATLWLSNQQLAGRDWTAGLHRLADALDVTLAPIVIVTNELGQGLVPATPEARAFRDIHGRMNQQLADLADLVVLVTAGLPQVLKGRLP